MLGPGTWTHSCGARPHQSRSTVTAPRHRQSLVGGQLIIVSPRWGSSVRGAKPDPTSLGILTELTLRASGGDIQVLGVYCPCPHPYIAEPPDTAPSNRLWDKAQAWLGLAGIALSP